MDKPECILIVPLTLMLSVVKAFNLKIVMRHGKILFSVRNFSLEFISNFYEGILMFIFYQTNLNKINLVSITYPKRSESMNFFLL